VQGEVEQRSRGVSSFGRQLHEDLVNLIKIIRVLEILTLKTKVVEGQELRAGKAAVWSTWIERMEVWAVSLTERTLPIVVVV
jgi:hypothetical protein